MKSCYSSLEEPCDVLYERITTTLGEQETKAFNEGAWPLEKLDEWKNTTLPDLLRDRREKGKCYLTSPELCRVMDWKLTKGKFRPALRGFIRQNDAKTVEQVTNAGFNMFLDEVEGMKKDDKYFQLVKSSMKELEKLKGVGPATSSLLLSLLHKITDMSPPFFSDESFIYYVVDARRPDSKIKYNTKEYIEEYLPIVARISDNSGVSMVKLEKIGYSLKMINLYGDLHLSDVKVPDIPKDLFHHLVESTTESVEIKTESKKRKIDDSDKKEKRRK